MHLETNVSSSGSDFYLLKSTISFNCSLLVDITHIHMSLINIVPLKCSLT